MTGRITPQTTFSKGDFRNAYFRNERKQEVFDRVNSITADLDIQLNEIAETALRFVLSHPAVSVVIPGMLSTWEVEQNCALGDGKGLTAGELSKLKNHSWFRNFYK